MRYHYFYQTRENADCDGWIEAKDRTDAYAKLRQQKIRPYKILGRNPLAWKRWTAIAVLTLVCVVLSVFLALSPTPAGGVPRSAERRQIYGDPFLLQQLSEDGWRKTFPDGGDAWLARHAIPGKSCDCVAISSRTNVISLALIPILATDSPELVGMKQSINCMKEELDKYLRGGGTQYDYMLLCDERIQKEQRFARRAQNQFEALYSRMGSLPYKSFVAEWERINESLRALGLPSNPLPEYEKNLQ